MPSFETLEWDSAFFGIKIGQVLLSDATSKDLAAAVEAADRDGIQCLYWLVRGEDRLSPRAAQACGFYLVDVRILFEALIETRPDSLASATEPDVPPVRIFESEDLPAILELTRQSYRDTRFFFDANFDEDKSMAMYERWVHRALQRRPDLIFVVGPKGEPFGYCICNVRDEHNAYLELMAVDPRWRGVGVASAMVRTVLRHFAGAGIHSMTGATQGRNVVMQRVFQRCGFVTKSMHLWYHRWAPGGAVRSALT